MSRVFLLVRLGCWDCDEEAGQEVAGVFATAEGAMASPLVTLPEDHKRERWGWRQLRDGSWGVRRLDTKSSEYAHHSHDWSVREWTVTP